MYFTAFFYFPALNLIFSKKIIDLNDNLPIGRSFSYFNIIRI